MVFQKPACSADFRGHWQPNPVCWGLLEKAKTVCQSGLCPCLSEWASGLAGGKREDWLPDSCQLPMDSGKPTQVVAYKIQTTLNPWEKALKPLRVCPRAWSQPEETPGELGLSRTPLGIDRWRELRNSLGLLSVLGKDITKKWGVQVRALTCIKWPPSATSCKEWMCELKSLRDSRKRQA